jgi:N-acyl-L-homoserine lactone synthetase
VINQTLKYYRQLGTEVPGLRTVIVNRPEQLSAAKELHARTYHALGFVTDADLSDNGLSIGPEKDPYQAHAQYFSVQGPGDGEPRTVATVRIIHADPGKGLESFPTYMTQNLYPKYRRMIEQLDPAACGEISALARDPGVSGKAALMLYRAVWHYSLERRYALLLVACDTRLYARCKMIFGASWMRIGRDGWIWNHPVVPVMIDIPNSLDEALKLSKMNPVKRRIKLKALEFFLRGLPEEAIRPPHRAKLDRYQLETAAQE